MAASPGGAEVGRISVRVVPDTSRLGPDLKIALDRLEAQTDLKISTSIDTTELDAQARAAVAQAQRAAGSINVQTKVDSSQINEASRAASGFAGSLGLIGTAAVLLGPALIPLVAVLGGLTLALAAPAILGTAGLTLFGFITGAAVKQTEAQNKKLLQLAAAVDTAKQSLASAKASAGTSAANSLASAQASAAASLKSAQDALANAKTTAQVSSAAQRIQAAHAALSARSASIQASSNASIAAAQRKVTDATLAYQAALAGMTPAQLKFIRAQDALKGAFHKLLESVGSSVLGPVTRTLQLLTTIMPKIKPILVSFAKVFDGFLTSAGDAVKSKGFSNLVHLIATKGAQSFKTFAGIVGNVFLAFGRLGKSLLPFGDSVLQGLGKASKSFADFAGSAKAGDAIRGFVDYMKQNGPQVGKTIGDLAVALGDIVSAAAPIGTVVLQAIDDLARAVQKIPKGVLTAIAVALGLIFANPIAVGIAAVVIGFRQLYNRSKPVRQIIGDLADYFKKNFLPQIKEAATKILPALKGAFKDINKAIRDNKPFLEAVGKAIARLAGRTILLGILTLVGAIKTFGKVVATGITVFHKFADFVLYYLANLARGFNIFLDLVLGVFGSIVDAQVKAFGWVPGLGPKVKAAAAGFHAFADGVHNSLNNAADNLDAFRRKIDASTKSPKPFKVTIDDINAVKHLERLQAFRLKDKSFTITANMVERIVGPGGGAGRDPLQAGSNLGPVAPPASRSVTSGSGGGASTGGSSPVVNVEKMYTRDLNDILRQSNNRRRARAGGGVLLGASS